MTSDFTSIERVSGKGKIEGRKRKNREKNARGKKKFTKVRTKRETFLSLLLGKLQTQN